MIHPAPTSRIDPTLARGTLIGVTPAGGDRPAQVIITFPNSSYELHLVGAPPPGARVGKRITGMVRARARRVDTVETGGRYVEPVVGRPRRIQGAIIATNDAANTITVDAGVPIECTLTDERQRAAQFAVGDFVSFDAMGGASFAAR